jgi:uncharacterized LabA/DUF88 family protein
VPISTHVYVDGFNLYNGLRRRAKKKGLAEPEFRWLDLRELAHRSTPGSEITKVWYFTSIVKDRAENPGAGERQEVFLRALKANGTGVVLGKFQRNKVWRRLVDNPDTSVRIIDFKEKGSDVHLATTLLSDAFTGACDMGVVISADSDLAQPIAIAAQKFRRGVVVLNPNHSHARSLERVATKYVRLSNRTLRASQFPEVVAGRIRKPDGW